MSEMPKVNIIGAGWNGLVIAKMLADAGYEVTVYEKNSDILSGISGKFGTRQHSGAHYPRSKITKAHCQQAIPEFNEYFEKYLDKILLDYGQSIYAYNATDTNNDEAKISQEEFIKVCRSLLGQEIDAETLKVNAESVFNLKEKFFPLGEALRELWHNIIEDTPNLTVKTNCEVDSITELREKCIVKMLNNETDKCDYVVNATAFQDLLPSQLPDNIEVIYQPTLAFLYEAKDPNLNLSSVTFMDGANPAFMPYHDGSGKNKILVTHCTHGILSTYKTISDANTLLANITDKELKELRKKFEHDLHSLYPAFDEENFSYLGPLTAINTKMVSDMDYRSTTVVKAGRLSYVIPGKIGDSVLAGKELLELISNKQENKSQTSGFEYVSMGTYDKATQNAATKETCAINATTPRNTANQCSVPALFQSPPQRGIKRSSSSLLVDQSMFQGQPTKKTPKLAPVNLMERFKVL